MASTALRLNCPVFHLEDKENNLCLDFTAGMRMVLPDESWIARWQELTVIRGPGLCLRVNLLWNGERILNERIVEKFGRIISKAEMWEQLLFSTTLELPNCSNCEEPEDSIIVHLTRSMAPDTEETSKCHSEQAASVGAVELLLPSLVPSASLVHIYLSFSFSFSTQEEIYFPKLAQLLPLTELALKSFWCEKVSQIAPVVGAVGYLHELAKRENLVGTIADSFERVRGRTSNLALKNIIEELAENDTGKRTGIGIETRVWRTMLERLKDNKTTKSKLKELCVCAGDDGDVGDMLLDQGDHLDIWEDYSVLKEAVSDCDREDFMLLEEERRRGEEDLILVVNEEEEEDARDFMALWENPLPHVSDFTIGQDGISSQANFRGCGGSQGSDMGFNENLDFMLEDRDDVFINATGMNMDNWTEDTVAGVMLFDY
ncbi:hypothetical protein RUND412_002081 [Rhizina undulata]